MSHDVVLRSCHCSNNNHFLAVCSATILARINELLPADASTPPRSSLNPFVDLPRFSPLFFFSFSDPFLRFFLIVLRRSSKASVFLESSRGKETWGIVGRKVGKQRETSRFPSFRFFKPLPKSILLEGVISFFCSFSLFNISRSFSFLFLSIPLSTTARKNLFHVCLPG